MTIIVHGMWLFRMFLYLAVPYDEYPLVGLPRGIASTGIVSIDVERIECAAVLLAFSRADHERQR